MSYIYNKKRMGPRILPCGTPHTTVDSRLFEAPQGIGIYFE